jgi:hypothetical protein
MSFILAAQRDSDEFTTVNWSEYQAHLLSLKPRFPKNAFRIATADWWYGFSTAKGPHDSRLISASILEESVKGRRKCALKISLRSAAGGTIFLSYPGVIRYQLEMPPETWPGHGDWRYDEFTLSDDGYLVHTIEWADGPTWVITAGNLLYKFIPQHRKATSTKC